MDLLKSILDVFVQIMSKPAILVGLIAMVGLISLKKAVNVVISGTVKTILGFLILSGGANIVVTAISPLGTLMQQGFGLEGTLPVNEVFTARAQEVYGVQISLVFFFSFLVNLLLARFTPHEICVPYRPSHIICRDAGHRYTWADDLQRWILDCTDRCFVCDCWFHDGLLSLVIRAVYGKDHRRE